MNIIIISCIFVYFYKYFDDGLFKILICKRIRIATSSITPNIHGNKNRCIPFINQGRAFTKFTTTHQFDKPNDLRAIELMN
jgi:hypothetical protein